MPGGTPLGSTGAGRAALRPMSVGEIIDASIKLYFRHFSTLVKVSALLLAPMYVLQALVRISLLPPPAHPSPQAPASPLGFLAPHPVQPAAIWPVLAGELLVGVLALLAGQLAAGALVQAISKGYMGEAPSWREALRVALSRLGSILLVGLMVGLGAVLGLLLFIAPGVYLYGAWAVVMPAVVLEGMKGRRALSRSRHLVKGRWWPTFGALAAGALLVAIVAAAIGGVLEAISGLAVHNSAAEIIVAQALTGITGICLAPFTATLVAVIYFDLRTRKEGLDLEMLAGTIGMLPGPGGQQ